MNSPPILDLGRNFAQKKNWHLAMFILGSSHQLVSSQLDMMQFLKCSHKLSFSSPVHLFFNPAGMKWRGRGPEDDNAKSKNPASWTPVSGVSREG